MKTPYLTLFLAIFLLNTPLFSQEIPNGGFENWEPTLLWELNPTDWTTDNMEVSAPVFPDSSAYSGELAMTLIPDVNGLGEGDAIAQTTVDITYVPVALQFYARWDKLNGIVKVDVSFYNETNQFFTETWMPDEDVSDWALITIPLPGIEPIITHAVITVSALVGDLAIAELSVDDMQFTDALGIEDLDLDNVEIGPVPCNDFLRISYDPNLVNDGSILVYDALGSVILHDRIKSELDVSQLSQGFYVLKVISDDRSTTKKFIVKR